MNNNFTILLLLGSFVIISSIENCKVQYKNQDFCNECEDGYGLNFEGGCKPCSTDEPISFMGICYKEIANCTFYQKYLDRDFCYTCESGFEFNTYHSKCIKCEKGKISDGKSLCVDENCISISIYNRNCDGCKNGYALAQNKIDCIKCDENKVAPFGKCIDKIENCKIYKDDKKL